MRRQLAIALTLSAVALSTATCTTRSRLYCDADSPCIDGTIPYCDLDGTFSGSENRCIENPFGTCETSAECPDSEAPVCEDTIGCLPCNTATEPDTACAERDALAPTCHTDGRCIGCMESSDCTGRFPICDSFTLRCQNCSPGAAGNVACTVRGGDTKLCSDAGQCVECIRDYQCTDPEMPFCGDDGLCRGCVENSECSTGVCNKESGGCVEEAQIHRNLYNQAPDGIIYIKLSAGGHGIPESNPPNYDGKIIVGSPTTSITSPFGIEIANGLVEDLRIATVVVGPNSTFRNVVLTNPTYGEPGRPIRIENSHLTSGARLYEDFILIDSLVDSEVGSNLNPQIITGNGSIVRTEFRSKGEIINKQGGSLIIDACTFTGNEAASVIRLDGTDYEIRNTFVVENAGTGIEIVNPAPTTAVLEFVTVVNNGGTGVICPAGGLPAHSSIIRGNQGAQVAGGCAWSYSNVEDGTAGTGNIDVDPGFLAPLAGIYHLGPDSPCIDAGDPNSTATTDIDGDPRPHGVDPDMGADEFVP